MLPFLEHDNKHFNTQRSLLPDQFAGCTCKISSTCGATSEHALCVQRSDTIDSSNCAVLSSRHSRNIKKIYKYQFESPTRSRRRSALRKDEIFVQIVQRIAVHSIPFTNRHFCRRTCANWQSFISDAHAPRLWRLFLEFYIQSVSASGLAARAVDAPSFKNKYQLSQTDPRDVLPHMHRALDRGKWSVS